MARSIGSKTDNGWVIEKLEVSDKLYKRIISNNLFKVYMNGEEGKWAKHKVYRRYYRDLSENLIIMLEFCSKDNLLQRAMIASRKKNLINNLRKDLN